MRRSDLSKCETGQKSPRRSQPEVKQTKQFQRKEQTSQPYVKEARKDREINQRAVPEVEQAQNFQRKEQTSMPEVKTSKRIGLQAISVFACMLNCFNKAETISCPQIHTCPPKKN